jgi:hypothetical protein
MKAIIRGHEALPNEHAEIQRFRFELFEGGDSRPAMESISLRTARVIVAHLHNGNAFIHMLRTIISSSADRLADWV